LLRRMRRQACTGGRKDLITLSKVDCGTLSYKELHGVTTLQDLELPEPLLPYSITSTLHCDRIVVLTEVPDRGMYIIATSFFFSSWLQTKKTNENSCFTRDSAPDYFYELFMLGGGSTPLLTEI